MSYQSPRRKHRKLSMEQLEGRNMLAAFSLTNGIESPSLGLVLDDGDVQIVVDEFGSFGTFDPNAPSHLMESRAPTYFNPVGTSGRGNTTYYSGVAIGFPEFSSRVFFENSTYSGEQLSPTKIETTFRYFDLSIKLTQTLSDTYTNGIRTGSLLTQTYELTNIRDGITSFDLIRYFDGDLFDSLGNDGGGRIEIFGKEYLFETDAAGSATENVTFVGITAEGGSLPEDHRFEIDKYSLFLGLYNRIQDGGSSTLYELNETIWNDSNGDQFIDAGNGYDVTLALSNQFSLGIGETVTYTTETLFGNGVPADITLPGSEISLPPPETILPETPAPITTDPSILPIAFGPSFAQTSLYSPPPKATVFFVPTEFGSNGYQPPEPASSTTNHSTGVSVHLEIGNDDLDDALLLTSFLDFLEPEILSIDLGDEPPAEAEKEATPTNDQPTTSAIIEADGDASDTAAAPTAKPSLGLNSRAELFDRALKELSVEQPIEQLESSLSQSLAEKLTKNSLKFASAWLLASILVVRTHIKKKNVIGELANNE